MKKNLVLMLLGVFLLCGCEAKQETTLTINEDKTMNFEVIMGYDDELIDAMMSMEENDSDLLNPTPEQDNDASLEEKDDETNLLPEEETNEEIENTDEERKQYLRDNNTLDIQSMITKGYTVLEFQDEKYTGYKISKKINNIDELTGMPDFSLDDYDKIEDKKIFEKNGNIYKGKIIVGDPLEMEEQESNDTSNAGVNLIYTFTLNLPNKAKNNNATTVSEDGKTLTWDLSKGNISTITFDFEFPSIFTFLKDNIILTAGISVVIVLLIIVIITIILKKSKAKNDKELNNIIKNNKNETLAQNNNMDMINPTDINTQPVNQSSVENKIVQPQLISNQQENQINNVPMQNTQMQNNINSAGIATKQQEMIPTQAMTQQQNIQPITGSNNQENIINAMNSIPVVSPLQTEKTIVNQPQELNMQQPVQNINNVQSVNTVPPIRPVVPTPINVQPTIQPQIQTTNATQGLSFVTGTVKQNTQPEQTNNNINQ